MALDIIAFLAGINTVKQFTDIFRKDKRIEELYNSKLEKRLQAVLESTIEFCVHRYRNELPEEMVKLILDNEQMLETVKNSLFEKNFIWDDCFILNGYGLDKDLQKSFVEFFFFALQNNMQRDLEIRRALRETGVYFAIDQIYDMTTVIYNKISKIDDIYAILNNWNENFISETMKQKNILKLKFYLRNIIDFSDETDRITINDIADIEEINFLKNEIVSVANITNNYVIKNKTKLVDNLSSSSFRTLSVFNNPAVKIPVKLSKDDEDNITKKLEDVFHISIDREQFFNVYGLRKNQYAAQLPFVGGSNWGYDGTDDEQAKWDLIEKLNGLIFIFDSYFKIKDFLNKYSIIPLVLVNDGTLNNEDVKVNIKLPKQSNILKQPDQNLAVFSYIAKYNGNRLIEELLCPKSDSKVGEFNIVNKNVIYNAGLFIHNKSLEELIELEKVYINDMFNFTIYEEDDHKVLEFELSSIRPNEKLLLPVYVLSEINNDIEIHYEVISNQNIEKEFKPLIYKI